MTGIQQSCFAMTPQFLFYVIYRKLKHSILHVQSKLVAGD